MYREMVVAGLQCHHPPAARLPGGENWRWTPPISARFHSHPLGDSYTDYIHYGPIIFVEKRTTVPVPVATRYFYTAARPRARRFTPLQLDFLGNEP